MISWFWPGVISAVVRLNEDDADLFERALNRCDEVFPYSSPALEASHRRRRHSGRACQLGRPPSKRRPRKKTLHWDNCNHLSLPIALLWLHRA